MRCTKLKADGKPCDRLMEMHGFDKDAGTVRWVCKACRREVLVLKKEEAIS